MPAELPVQWQCVLCQETMGRQSASPHETQCSSGLARVYSRRPGAGDSFYNSCLASSLLPPPPPPAAAARCPGPASARRSACSPGRGGGRPRPRPRQPQHSEVPGLAGAAAGPGLAPLLPAHQPPLPLSDQLPGDLLQPAAAGRGGRAAPLPAPPLAPGPGGRLAPARPNQAGEGVLGVRRRSP